MSTSWPDNRQLHLWNYCATLKDGSECPKVCHYGRICVQLQKQRVVNQIQAVNVAALKNAENTPLKKTPYYTLLRLLAEGCDSNAQDKNFYCTLGSTKSLEAISLIIRLEGDKDAAYATTLVDLCVELIRIVGAP